MGSIYVQAIDVIEELLDRLDIPEPNCTCFKSAPCSDCMDNSSDRFLRTYADSTIKRLKTYDLLTPKE